MDRYGDGHSQLSGSSIRKKKHTEVFARSSREPRKPIGVEPAGSQTPSRKLSLVKCEMSPQAQVFQTWLPAAGAAREAVRAFGDTSWPEERKLRVLGSEFRLLARPILSLNY